MSEKKVIVPVVCVAKTTKDQKEFWKSQGLDLVEIEKKLTYKFLSGLEHTGTGLKIKEVLQRAATEIASIYDGALKDGAMKDIEIEGTSILEKRMLSLAFGKTIRADAVRLLANLPPLPSAVAEASSDEENNDEGIEL